MATPVFCCGFECGQITSGPGVGQHWIGLIGTASVDTSTVRSGARSLRCNPTASNGRVTAPTFSGSRLVGRFYVRFTTLPSANTRLCQYDNSGPAVYFQQSSSKIFAAVGTAGSETLGASGVDVTTGQWYRIDCDFNVNTGGSDTCDVQVNGTACGQATATGSSSSSPAPFIGIIQTCTADAYFDDVVFSSTGADYPFGAGHVNHFVPASDGAHNVAGTADFRRTLTATDILNSTTDAFELVNDVPLESGASVDWINMLAPPNATDYVECVFGPAAGISAPSAGPRAVEVIAAIHQAATGTGNMEIRMNDNGTTDAMYSATTVAGVTSIIYKRKHYAVAIAGGGAWVIGGGGDGDFTDLRVRFGSPAALDVNPDQYFDCIMIEAEFSDVPKSMPIFSHARNHRFHPQRRIL